MARALGVIVVGGDAAVRDALASTLRDQGCVVDAVERADLRADSTLAFERPSPIPMLQTPVDEHQLRALVDGASYASAVARVAR